MSESRNELIIASSAFFKAFLFNFKSKRLKEVSLTSKVGCFSTDFNAKPEAEAEAVEVVEAKDVEIKDSDE